MVVWGSGLVKREFLYVDDLAAATVFIMNLDSQVYANATHEMCSHLNIGSGQEVSIKYLVNMIAKIIEFKGIINFDLDKPEGAPRKLVDSSLINSMGWAAKVNLESGIKIAYKDMVENRL